MTNGYILARRAVGADGARLHPMKKEAAYSTTHLFMVRIWSETVGDGQTEWRGKVQHVLTGERHYFRDWRKLIDYLLDMLPDDEAPPSI